MDTLTDKAVDMAANHAAEFVRLLGRQEMERRELMRRHWTETRTLQLAERAAGEGLPYESPAVTPIGNLMDLLRRTAPPANAPAGVPLPLGDDPPATQIRIRVGRHWDLREGATETCTAPNPCAECRAAGRVHSGKF